MIWKKDRLGFSRTRLKKKIRLDISCQPLTWDANHYFYWKWRNVCHLVLLWLTLLGLTLNLPIFFDLKILSAYYICCTYSNASPGRVAQSVTCLATDACLTADPGVASSIPVLSHTFVETDHEMISTVILLPSADSFKKGCCQLQVKVCAQITG